MKFLPKSTCEALVKMGCKSTSQFYWRHNDLHPICIQDGTFAYDIELSTGFNTPSFSSLDFLGDTETSINNCKILFQCPSTLTALQGYRHALLDSTDQVEFLVKAVDGK